MTSRRRRIYLTVIAIGLVLVAIDQLYVQDGGADLGPSKATAQTSRPRGGDAAAAAERGFARVWVPPVSLEVPQAWRELAEHADRLMRQPFSPAAPLRDAGLAGAESDEATAPAPAITFAERHRLEAVLSSQTRPRAIIDGQVVTIDESVEGFVVEAIEGRSVTLRGPDGQTVRLDMPLETLQPSEPPH